MQFAAEHESGCGPKRRLLRRGREAGYLQLLWRDGKNCALKRHDVELSNHQAAGRGTAPLQEG
jgi:hypothetical protein